MIKEQKIYNFPADQLTVYVAKTHGHWLQSDDPDVRRMERDETPPGTVALMNQAYDAIGFPDDDDDDVGEGEILILVDAPSVPDDRSILRTLRA